MDTANTPSFIDKPDRHGTALERIAFLSILAFFLLMPYVSIAAVYKVLLAVPFIFVGRYLYVVRLRLFVPALFFIMNALLGPFVFPVMRQFGVGLPQIYFLPVILMYLGIVLSVPRLRAEIRWLKIGVFNRPTIILSLTVVVLSAFALFLWARFIADDLDRFRAFVPDVSIGFILLYGLLFAVTNSLFETFFARAVLYDGFSAIFTNIIFVIGAQALVFALWHVNGFPGGFVGVAMVLVWSSFLGVIRHVSGGMVAPLVTHFFADASIALIVFLS